MRLSLPPWLLSLPLRVKVLTAVGIACLVALLFGVLGDRSGALARHPFEDVL